ncbi:MAG: ABC transporter substrate-binding protein [Actinobacteria bacterium]|nr:ABC transporter substrate-binding protein [Actinomycetota bacterium]
MSFCTSRRRHARIACASGLLAVATACASPSGSGPELTVNVPVTTVAPEQSGDGVVQIAAFLPATGPGARIGTPMSDADINAAGGVLGNPLEVNFVDEATSNDLGNALQSDVDAIVGPASSLNALSMLGDAVESGVLSCSPTATSLLLDRFPDTNLFFRTVGSDSLQMAAVARTAARTGGGSVTIVHLDDPYGRGLAQALERAIELRPSLALNATIPFSGSDPNLDDDADSVIKTGSRVIVLLGDEADGGRMLSAIDLALPNDAGVAAPFVVVNDGLRSASDTIATISDRLREQIIGVAARAIVTTIDNPVGYFSTNAYDCVMLIALAARQAGSDTPRSIANQMASVSSGGRLCTTYADCAELIDQGLQIDYNGRSGAVDLNATGDLSRAWFREFRFDDDGREYIFNEVGIEVSS